MPSDRIIDEAPGLTVSYADTDELWRRAGELLGDRPEYGDNLLSGVAGYAPFGDWLQAAVVAGHLPTLEGVNLAVQAYHLMVRGQLASETAQGERLAWARMADAYRDLISELETYVADLETHAAQEWAQPPAGLDDERRRQWAKQARRAQARARNAAVRREAVLQDNPRED